MDEIAALQLVIGPVLVWAGVGKLASRLSAARALRSALPRLVGETRAPLAYRMTGLVELLVGGALLVPPFWRLDAVAALVLTGSFVGYLVYARRSAPDSSCGCLGSAEVPVSSRSIARGIVLVTASGAMLFSATDWTTVVRESPWPTAVVVLLGLAAIVALSPELDRLWLLRLRRIRVRLTHPLAATPPHIPLNSTEQRLLRSPAYRAVGSVVRSDVIEHWDDGDWRFVTYAGVHNDQRVTAVFAVPLSTADPDTVRVALVDEASGETIYRGGAPLAVT